MASDAVKAMSARTPSTINFLTIAPRSLGSLSTTRTPRIRPPMGTTLLSAISNLFRICELRKLSGELDEECAVAASVLTVVERPVGGREQIVILFHARRSTHADGHGDRQLSAIRRHGSRAHTRQHVVGYASSGAGVAARQQNRKLVAAPARRGVVDAFGDPQGIRDVQQGLIAGAVTVLVVDPLEMIDVYKQ